MKSRYGQLSSSAFALSQFIQKKEILGVGLCRLDLSGCYDIGRVMCLQLSIPYIRVQYDSKNSALSAISGDLPTQSSKKYKAIFFTGCQAKIESMATIVDLLSREYRFTELHHIFHITPPHIVFPKQENYYELVEDEKELLQ